MGGSGDTAASVLAEVHKLVDLVLRYVAAGGSAVLAFGLIQGRNFEFLRAGPGQQDVSGWLVLLFISILGVAIYAVHRAVLYRVVSKVPYTIVGLFFVTPRCGPWQLDKDTRDRRIERRKRNDPWQLSFDAWAAECHFLYCSAWGTLLAVALANAIDLPWDQSTLLCVIVGLTLLLSAFIHDGCLLVQEMRR